MENNPTVPLRDYIDTRFDGVNKATNLFKEETDRRLQSLNDLRNEVLEDRQQFVTQAVYNTTEVERTKWRETVAQRITIIETRSVTWTTAIGIFFTIIQLVMWVAYYLVARH